MNKKQFQSLYIGVGSGNALNASVSVEHLSKGFYFQITENETRNKAPKDGARRIRRLL